MRKAITSIYLIVNKQEFPSRHKLLPVFYCHFPIVVVVTISIIFRCCSCCCSKLNSWFTRLVASNNIYVHFFRFCCIFWQRYVPVCRCCYFSLFRISFRFASSFFSFYSFAIAAGLGFYFRKWGGYDLWWGEE